VSGFDFTQRTQRFRQGATRFFREYYPCVFAFSESAAGNAAVKPDTTNLLCTKTAVMKKILFITGVIIVGLSIALIQSCKSKGSAARILKFNLEKGKEYDYEIIWDLDQKVNGQDTKMSLSGLYTLKVTNDDGHIKELTSAYKKFRLNMKMMGFEMDVDTDKPSPPLSEEEMKQNPMGMVNRMFAGIVGKPFIMKVNEEGELVEVKGFQEILIGMVDAAGLGEETKAVMMASLRDQFNEQTIKDQFAQVFSIFPNKEIKVGDTWEKNYTIGGKMPSKNTTVYTVKEMDGDRVILGTKTRIGSNGEMDVNGSQTGDVVIDSRTGLMTSGEFDQNIDVKTPEMSMEIKGKGKIKGKAN
jgi:Family of unknown function (DUF6263)